MPIFTLFILLKVINRYAIVSTITITTSPHMSGMLGAWISYSWSGLPDLRMLKNIRALMMFPETNLRLIPMNVSDVPILKFLIVDWIIVLLFI